MGIVSYSPNLSLAKVQIYPQTHLPEVFRMLSPLSSPMRSFSEESQDKAALCLA